MNLSKFVASQLNPMLCAFLFVSAVVVMALWWRDVFGALSNPPF